MYTVITAQSTGDFFKYFVLKIYRFIFQYLLEYRIEMRDGLGRMCLIQTISADVPQNLTFRANKLISMMLTACLPQHSQNPTRTKRSLGLIRNKKNRFDKASLISKKIEMKVNEYLPNLDVEVPV
jgi:hypothetical protein